MAEIYCRCLRLTKWLIFGSHSECQRSKEEVEWRHRELWDDLECISVINEPGLSRWPTVRGSASLYTLRFDRCRSLQTNTCSHTPHVSHGQWACFLIIVRFRLPFCLLVWYFAEHFVCHWFRLSVNLWHLWCLTSLMPSRLRFQSDGRSEIGLIHKACCNVLGKCYFKTHVWGFPKPCTHGENDGSEYILCSSLIQSLMVTCVMDHLQCTMGYSAYPQICVWNLHRHVFTNKSWLTIDFQNKIDSTFMKKCRNKWNPMLSHDQFVHI